MRYESSMFASREMRHIVEASIKAGDSKEETRKLINGSLFDETSTGILAELQNEDIRERLLRAFEVGEEPASDVYYVVQILERFSRLNLSGGEQLNEKDIRFLSFGMKYLEDWFYRADWVDGKDGTQSDSSEYLLAPAAIVNMLTKIKEIPEYSEKISDFEKERFRKFRDDVHEFARLFLSVENLSQLTEDADSLMYKQFLQQVLDRRRDFIDTFWDSEFSVEAELRRGSSAADLYFLKTCLIAAEIMRRETQEFGEHVFLPEQSFPTERNEYRLFNFRERGQYGRMHYPTHRLPYCKFAVEYLFQKRNDLA